MNFIPKINKIKKKFKGKNFNKLFKNVNANPLFIGSIGLQAQEAGNISSTVFEATKQSIKKVIKKAGRVIFIGFPQHAKTKKPLEMRMGKGKGNVDHWVCRVQPGFIFCEVNTQNKKLGIKALITAQYRLPIKTKIDFDN